VRRFALNLRGDFVFHRPDGSTWSDIGDSIEDLVEAAGLQKNEAPQRLTPHSFRHTFASWLAIAGVSLRRIQELLVHKSVTTTERYSVIYITSQPQLASRAPTAQNGPHPER
jgi:site-specific recombinase XerD